MTNVDTAGERRLSEIWNALACGRKELSEQGRGDLSGQALTADAGGAQTLHRHGAGVPIVLRETEGLRGAKTPAARPTPANPSSAAVSSLRPGKMPRVIPFPTGYPEPIFQIRPRKPAEFRFRRPNPCSPICPLSGAGHSHLLDLDE